MSSFNVADEILSSAIKMRSHVCVCIRMHVSICIFRRQRRQSSNFPHVATKNCVFRK